MLVLFLVILLFFIAIEYIYVLPVTTSNKPINFLAKLFSRAESISCSGIKVTSGDDLYSLISSNGSGSTFCLAAGKYNIKSSIPTRANNVYIGSGTGESGTILDFSNATSLTSLNDTSFGFYGYGGSDGQHDVTVKNLVIQNCQGPNKNCIGMKQGSNWKVENVEIRDNSIGFTGNCNNCYIHHNKTYGVTSPATITNSEISYNGGIPDPGTSTGASKAVQVVNSTWTGNYIHDNEGPGIWCDGCWQGSTFIIQNNRIENNMGGGIVFEITWGAPYSNIVVSGNQLKGNSFDYIGKSCFWAAQILVQNSSGITISNNTIDSTNGENALCVVDTVRNDGLPKYPEIVTPFIANNNTFILSGSALVGEQGNNDGSYTVNSSNITFNNNTYRVDSLNSAHWQLNSGSLTWTQWRNLGEDPNGQIVQIGSSTPVATNTPTKTPTPTPTKISVTPTKTPTPTNKPSVTPTKIPSSAPTATPTPINCAKYTTKATCVPPTECKWLNGQCLVSCLKILEVPICTSRSDCMWELQ